MWVIQSSARLPHDRIVLGWLYVTLTQNEKKIVELDVLKILSNFFSRFYLIQSMVAGLALSFQLGLDSDTTFNSVYKIENGYKKNS